MLETKYIILFITLIIFAVVIVGLVIYISSEQPQPVTVTPPLPSPVTVTPPLPSPVTVTPSSLPPAPTIPSPVIFPAPIPEPATNVLSTPAIVGIVIGIILILVRLLFYLNPTLYYKWFDMNDTKLNVRRVASSPVRLASKVVALPVETVLKVPVKLTQIAFRPLERKFIRDTLDRYVQQMTDIQNNQNIKKALYFLTWYSEKDINHMYDFLITKDIKDTPKTYTISRIANKLSNNLLEIGDKIFRYNGIYNGKPYNLFPWTSIFKKNIFKAWYGLALNNSEQIQLYSLLINKIINGKQVDNDEKYALPGLHYRITENANKVCTFIELYNTQTGFFKDWLLKFKLMDF